jgi:hypothetical protein
MQRIAKITPSDSPDLLAAVDEGISERELARRYDCAPSLVHRHLARAKRARELTDRVEGPDTERSVEPIEGSVRDILEARIRDPHISARDLASLMNARSKLDAEEASAPGDELRLQLVAARRRVRELERANFRLPIFMPGVNEWFDALPPEVDTWSHLPGAPVELIDSVGDAHHVMPEDVWFFVEHLGWTTPPLYDPEDELIEEWRAKIAEYDARRALELVGPAPDREDVLEGQCSDRVPFSGTMNSSS